MDGAQFDTLLRSLTATSSRRGAAVGLLGGVVSMLGLTESEAKHKKHKNHNKKKRRGGSPPSITPAFTASRPHAICRRHLCRDRREAHRLSGGADISRPA